MTKIPASAIIYGTMRMLEKSRSISDWADFLREIHQAGIRTLHSSDEYESFPLLCEALSTLRRENPGLVFRHVVKLAEPSFDDRAFSQQRLTQKLEGYRLALGVRQLSVVQWMWRADLTNESKRQSDFHSEAAKLEAAFTEVRAQGLVDEVVCFPYTPGFALRALEFDWLDGLAVYRNPNEPEYNDALNGAAARDALAYVIRPFAGGHALSGASGGACELLRFAYAPTAVKGIVVTATERAHIQSLLECIEHV